MSQANGTAAEEKVQLVQNPKLSLSAWVLLRFCRAPGTRDYPMSGVYCEPGKELARLEEVWPDLRRDFADKIVIDFGCGMGYQSTAFALAGARHVIGVDIADLEFARQRVADLGLADKVSFAAKIPEGLEADIIVSQNSFEHFIGAAVILAELRAALAAGGKVFLTFAPPWYAPWGAHMAYFCRLPWVQVLFSERTVMQVRSLFRSDGKWTYRDAGLAEMSLVKFEQLIKECGLRCVFKRYDCSWGLNWLRHTPLRELFVNRVSCVLMA